MEGPCMRVSPTALSGHFSPQQAVGHPGLHFVHSSVPLPFHSYTDLAALLAQTATSPAKCATLCELLPHRPDHLGAGHLPPGRL